MFDSDRIYVEYEKLYAKCEELKKYKDVVNNLAGMQIILTNKDKMPELYENVKDLKLEEYKQALEPFEDDYFKDLDTKTIAELAKKSIRLTTENRKFEDALDEIEDIIKQPEMKLQNTILYSMLELDNYISTRRRHKLAQILAIINKAKEVNNADIRA